MYINIGIMNDKVLIKIEKSLNRIANNLEKKSLSISLNDFDYSYSAFIWEAKEKFLRPAYKINSIPLFLLKGIEEQSKTLYNNTLNFCKGLPANNALLWGARGGGKSSLVKSIYSELHEKVNKNLSIIEINREDLETLPQLLVLLNQIQKHFIIFCDDLSFDKNDTKFKSLKSVLEGGIEGKPNNVIFYATSNRRHLMASEMIENERSGAISPTDTINETISLSDRFGLWLGFHNIDQNTYLEIVSGYLKHYQLEIKNIDIEQMSLEWSSQRGSRSGRVAWQFVIDLAGKLEKNID